MSGEGQAVRQTKCPAKLKRILHTLSTYTSECSGHGQLIPRMAEGPTVC